MNTALRARIHHEVGNWITQTDASNALKSILRKPMLEQVAQLARQRLRAS